MMWMSRMSMFKVLRHVCAPVLMQPVVVVVVVAVVVVAVMTMVSMMVSSHVVVSVNLLFIFICVLLSFLARHTIDNIFLVAQHRRLSLLV